MSSTPSALVQDDRLLNYMCYAATALCCYDYCLTFEREVEHMWRNKLTAASALFYTFRYTALLDVVVTMLGYLSWPSWQTTRSCVIIIRLQMAGDVLILTSAAVFAAMRIYALFHQNRTLLVLILVLGLVNPVISMYTFINSTPILFHVTPTYQTCSIDTPYISNFWMLGARVSSVVSDSLVLILTWKGTRNVAISHGLKKTLMTDTAIYFGFLFLLNFGGICIAIAQLEFIDAISTLTAILTSIFLSRLILDLHSVIHICSQPSTAVLSTVESLVFTEESGWVGAMELPQSNDGRSLSRSVKHNGYHPKRSAYESTP